MSGLHAIESKMWADVNRVEVIELTGSSFLRWQDGIKVMTALQDAGKTLNIFIDSPLAAPKDDLLEALRAAYEDLHRANPNCVRLAWYRSAIAKAEGK